MLNCAWWALLHVLTLATAIFVRFCASILLALLLMLSKKLVASDGCRDEVFLLALLFVLARIDELLGCLPA